MPAENYQWGSEIKAVEKEYNAMRLAADRLLEAVRVDPNLIRDKKERAYLKVASDNLEPTYVMRLFAQFETALKSFLTLKKLRVPRIAEALLNKAASKRRIGNDLLSKAHAIREYRNVLTHERDKPMEAIEIRKVTSKLCTFVSQLQLKW